MDFLSEIIGDVQFRIQNKLEEQRFFMQKIIDSQRVKFCKEDNFVEISRYNEHCENLKKLDEDQDHPRKDERDDQRELNPSCFSFWNGDGLQDENDKSCFHLPMTNPSYDTSCCWKYTNNINPNSILYNLKMQYNTQIFSDATSFEEEEELNFVYPAWPKCSTLTPLPSYSTYDDAYKNESAGCKSFNLLASVFTQWKNIALNTFEDLASIKMQQVLKRMITKVRWRRISHLMIKFDLVQKWNTKFLERFHLRTWYLSSRIQQRMRHLSLQKKKSLRKHYFRRWYVFTKSSIHQEEKYIKATYFFIHRRIKWWFKQTAIWNQRKQGIAQLHRLQKKNRVSLIWFEWKRRTKNSKTKRQVQAYASQKQMQQVWKRWTIIVSVQWLKRQEKYIACGFFCFGLLKKSFKQWMNSTKFHIHVHHLAKMFLLRRMFAKWRNCHRQYLHNRSLIHCLGLMQKQKKIFLLKYKASKY